MNTMWFIVTWNLKMYSSTMVSLKWLILVYPHNTRLAKNSKHHVVRHAMLHQKCCKDFIMMDCSLIFGQVVSYCMPWYAGIECLNKGVYHLRIKILNDCMKKSRLQIFICHDTLVHRQVICWKGYLQRIHSNALVWMKLRNMILWNLLAKTLYRKL